MRGIRMRRRGIRIKGVGGEGYCEGSVMRMRRGQERGVEDRPYHGCTVLSELPTRMWT
jgi:hypothetical protein